MSKFTHVMKKVGKALDDTADLIKKLDPNPVDVALITLVQESIKILDKEVSELYTMAAEEAEKEI